MLIPFASRTQEELDRLYMGVAIGYSRRALGRTWPNPSVGAVLVRFDKGHNGGQIVGRGVTQPVGGAHAEVVALQEAGALAKGATAYVTLEPCSHTGRTGPCSKALIEAGVRRVVYAVTDPNPLVCGCGHRQLAAANVEVSQGVLQSMARQPLAGYLSLVEKQRPYIMLKMAVSEDGYIGRKGSGQIRITGHTSRQMVHSMRGQVDAIAVGIGTVLEDDPNLQNRLPGCLERSPVAVVFDAKARLPLDSQLARRAKSSPVWLLVGAGIASQQYDELEAMGVRLLPVALDSNGKIDLPQALKELGRQGITKLMLEGGAQLAAAFLQDSLIDEALIFKGAQKLDNGLLPFGSFGLEKLHSSMNGKFLQACDADELWHYTKF
ncbi:bifunctional diaminohydroxyphosphoribosylaminopyrimidine deaminase/5-amino-6-(5-phosphoribosylamino)uracil reductase RibD [Polycladidibacter stylochi]|uniref:bifunctional diaminohydroxyphosphoribosylaminopyrimidine deaminase/5-amino-6-(5-phosphoribosylamino)uracil reductase RibD n=1 Tax=Polycladidibacter stylochi TaxID=1807766 RepID=UPI0008371909|nr:bifunctional diaminohydroxyphosphoribosylaminopyrimidine deaminase/5-amino-6-(5-phosphoribosylamino)uracil reductase RibD [Pseudovibrio stylochi]